MKAKDLKNNNSIEIELGNKKYNLNFDFNTFCKLEELGTYENAQEAFDDLQKGKFTAIRALLWAAINSEKDIMPIIEVGKNIDYTNMQSIFEDINKALAESMPEVDEDIVEEDEEEKN